MLILVTMFNSLHVLSPSFVKKTKLPVVTSTGTAMHLVCSPLEFALRSWFFACAKSISSLIARVFPNSWYHWNIISLEERPLEHIQEFNDSWTESTTSLVIYLELNSRRKSSCSVELLLKFLDVLLNDSILVLVFWGTCSQVWCPPEQVCDHNLEHKIWLPHPHEQ